ncbi:hypothetical protein FRX31_011686 [Thalictrum thalictroides]|uniref:Uncharacterized protein n=1 Tax=Thalictrum thalictroides TaxID=46969 RepID=A0A7J6WRI1_THATH|nr:hypothetical protein FRX31_011686 [Thalictrum thalictroides]
MSMLVLLFVSIPSDKIIMSSLPCSSSSSSIIVMIPTRRLLSSTGSSHHELHPQQQSLDTADGTSFSSRSTSTPTSRQFEASAHEVPSGPNPISNR